MGSSLNAKKFQELFECLYVDLVRYAYRYVFDQKISEDLVQDVFVQLWEKGDSYIIERSMKSYIYTMVRHRCINYLKKLKIQEPFYFVEHLHKIDTSYDFEALQNHQKPILEQQMEAVLELLPKRMRSIILLKYFSNYTHKEIADELNISINTVKTQLIRAKNKIRTLLLQYVK